MGVDIIGTFFLFKNSKKRTPILRDFWCISNTKGGNNKDSCYIYFIDKKMLQLGESCSVEFKYKFSDDSRFEKDIKVGDIIELCEGEKLIGELVVETIFNNKLLNNQ